MSQEDTAVESTSRSVAILGADAHLVTPAAEVTWGDFLAALPTALAMHPEGNSGREPAGASRIAGRRGGQRNATLPRAYMAARAVARRERASPPSAETSPPIVAKPHSLRAIAESESSDAMSASIAPSARTGLATADRWLLAGLMLTSSVLVAVLTSTLTVRGMQRSVAPPVAARAETVVTVAAAPSTAASSAAAQSTAAQSTVAPDSSTNARVVTPPVEHHAALVAKRVRAVPPATRQHLAQSAPTQQLIAPAQRPAVTPPSIAPSSQTVPSSSPAASSSPATPSPAVASPSATPAPAPASVNNAQFLEELRAIHAEIDARKKHMDSLTASLDSLKRIKP